MCLKLKCYTSKLCNNCNVETELWPKVFLKANALFMDDALQRVLKSLYSCICDSWKRSLEIIRVNSLIRSDCLCPFEVDFPGLACCWLLLVCFCKVACSDFLTGLCCWCGCCCSGAWDWWTEDGLVIILGGDVCCCWGTWTCCCCCCWGTFCCCWPELNDCDILFH